MGLVKEVEIPAISTKHLSTIVRQCKNNCMGKKSVNSRKEALFLKSSEALLEEYGLLAPIADLQLASSNFHKIALNGISSALLNGNPYFKSFVASLQLNGRHADAKKVHAQFLSILDNAEKLLIVVTAIAAGERQFGN
jgi:hypothetical protein